MFYIIFCIGTLEQYDQAVSKCEAQMARITERREKVYYSFSSLFSLNEPYTSFPIAFGMWDVVWVGGGGGGGKTLSLFEILVMQSSKSLK